MGMLFALSLPGLVCLLVLLAALERFGLWAGRRSWLPWRRGRPADTGGTPLSAIGFEEMAGLFYASKHDELAQRRTELMLRDEENDGAPPRGGIDLDGGTVFLDRRRPVD
ncbi:hypothetical protein F0L68_01830 [Solihabitans fulvus]|uniref:Uncharacterized protein n=1 Tax=Solihabitans fulvus TaxID=1892852 RepID=A0A5B2XSS9_9PSEU|nr:DUF6191 domain-containing protein [Solihabitans fulvus]KAA2266506.1 hypothetical protein F0L68_01830 [Solihabitans fulvus]